MAVNKNFVVKNGLEVNTNLILADVDTGRVGVGTTAPDFLLDVHGGIGATTITVSGFSTFITGVKVGTSGTTLYASDTLNRVGVGTAAPEYPLDVRSTVSTGQTALYVYGDMRVTGDINLDDITLDDATIQDLNITGLSTFAGYVDINNRVDISNTLKVAGITTLASSGGITTTGGDLYVGGDLFVRDDVVYDEVTGRNLNITGIATIGTLIATASNVTGITTTKDLLVTGVTTSTDKEIYTQFDITNNSSGAYEFAATGIGFTQATDNPTLYLTKGKNYRFSVNASGHPFFIKTVNSTGVGNSYNDGVTNNGAAVGIITFKVPYNAPDILYYNCQNHSAMNGEIRVGASGGGVGVGSEGTFIGAGVTMIDFKTTSGTNINSVDLNAGIATVTIQPGVSLGLAIALGG